MKLITKSILLSLLALSSSCAYFGNAKTVDVSIASNPSGADVFIEGRNYGKTPLTLNIEPKGYVVTVTKEGHGSAIVNLEAWQAIREGASNKGDGGRCIADVIGTMLVIPYFSYQSVYCRDFKQKEYFVNIPYIGANAGRVDSRGMPNPQDAAAMANYYYNQDMNNYKNSPQKKR